MERLQRDAANAATRAAAAEAAAAEALRRAATWEKWAAELDKRLAAIESVPAVTAGLKTTNP